MASTKTDFKRRFPKVGRCCCCCAPKVSVYVCTIILIVFYVIGIFFSGLSLNKFGTYTSSVTNILSKVELVVPICVTISLILLLIGIEKRNKVFMNQFKIVFFIYLIYSLFSFIYGIYLFNNDEYVKESIKTLKNTYKEANMPNLSELPDEFYQNSIKNSMKFYIVEVIVIYALFVYYYLSTCSYIEDIEEGANDENDIRNLENNEY
jgi:glucan phosphoethanolaminetransferase (alkaline phosphatase superfamily)